MNAFLLWIPILLLRYLLLGMISKNALQRAAHFAPVRGNEKIAYGVYQLTMLAMLFGLIFFRVQLRGEMFIIGLVSYGIGIALYAASIVYYAMPNKGTFNDAGLYRISRNPMYVAFFISLLGCVLLIQSWILLAVLLVFQIASHWIILSEERWCVDQFGADYAAYMRKVRRYI